MTSETFELERFGTGSRCSLFVVDEKLFPGTEVRNFINSWTPDDEIDMIETQHHPACSGKRGEIISHPLYRASVKMGRTRSGKVWNNELFFQIIKFSSAKKTWTPIEAAKVFASFCRSRQRLKRKLSRQELSNLFFILLMISRVWWKVFESFMSFCFMTANVKAGIVWVEGHKWLCFFAISKKSKVLEEKHGIWTKLFRNLSNFYILRFSDFQELKSS